MTAYSDTSVPVARSQEAIRQILKKADVRGINFGEDFETNTITIRFAKNIGGNFHTVSVSMKVPEPPPTKRKRSVSWRRGRAVYGKLPSERQEQMTRATYRALHYWLKSQFEAIDFGLVNFEDVFLSHFEWMMKDGTKGTLGQLLKPQFDQPALQVGKDEWGARVD